MLEEMVIHLRVGGKSINQINRKLKGCWRNYNVYEQNHIINHYTCSWGKITLLIIALTKNTLPDLKYPLHTEFYPFVPEGVASASVSQIWGLHGLDMCTQLNDMASCTQ